MCAKKNSGKKLTMVLVAIILVLCCTIGGTLAWLKDTTAPVTNTFTVGKVEITLKESPLQDNGEYGQPAEGTKNAYPLVPGKTYQKDPTVAVDTSSEDCWLFVKFEETVDADKYIQYTSTLTTDNKWIQGTGTIPTDVWYRHVNKTDDERSWKLLADDKIQIKTSVTADNMAAAAAASLQWTAYAVQSANDTATFSPEQAWDIALDGTLTNP